MIIRCIHETQHQKSVWVIVLACFRRLRSNRAIHLFERTATRALALSAPDTSSPKLGPGWLPGRASNGSAGHGRMVPGLQSSLADLRWGAPRCRE
jgi:hypothetical protein